MATSTFYDKIVIGKEAAQILVDGLNGPKLPRPEVPEGMKWERNDEVSERFRSNLRKSAQTQKKNWASEEQ